MLKLPELFEHKMKDLFKDEYEQYIESFQDKRVYGLRVNEMKINPDQFKELAGFDLKEVPWTSNG